MTKIPLPPTGIRPTPHDRVFPVRGGTSIKLGPFQNDGISNQSEFNCDWVVKIRPGAASMPIITSENWGVRGALTVNYDGDQFLEFQPIVNPAQALLLLPVVGICIGVHGRYINLRLERNAGGAGTGEIDIEAAITTGRPSHWYKSDVAPSSAGTPALIPLPVFATRFQVLVTLTAGDTLQQIAPDGATVLQSVTLTAGMFAFPQPIHPLAAFIRYTTVDVAVKQVVAGFEVVS